MITVLLSALMVPFFAFSEPSPPQLLKSENSKCLIQSSGGEYPIYTVFKGKKSIYSPKSDGVTAALISPTGKYAALSAGEISLLDVEENQFEFGVVIVNCESGKVKGYRKGRPSLIKGWWPEDKGLDLWEGLNLAGNSGESLP